MVKIKPCPFCGSEGEILGSNDFFCVLCNNTFCLAEGPGKKTKGWAVRAWNRRVK